MFPLSFIKLTTSHGGLSSNGRALASHARGKGIDAPSLQLLVVPRFFLTKVTLAGEHTYMAYMYVQVIVMLSYYMLLLPAGVLLASIESSQNFRIRPFDFPTFAPLLQAWGGSRRRRSGLRLSAGQCRVCGSVRRGWRPANVPQETFARDIASRRLPTMPSRRRRENHTTNSTPTSTPATRTQQRQRRRQRVLQRQEQVS